MKSRLFTLLLLLVVIGSSFVALDQAVIVILPIVLGLAIYIRFSPAWPLPVRCAIWGVCLLIVLAMLMPAFPNASWEYIRRASCVNNLKQIGLALHNYQDWNRHLPPACTYDNAGRPMRSWRVAILPAIECAQLYERYDRNEPWDGPHNRQLLAERPSVYACPSDSSAQREGSTATNYVAVVGGESVWQRGKTINLKAPNLSGKQTTTILLIEMADSDIAWMEPRDLSWDELDKLSQGPLGTVHTMHTYGQSYYYHDTPYGYFNVLLLDGSARTLPVSALSAAKLKRLLAVGGCTEENINAPDDLGEPQINWPHCIALPVWGVSVVLLLVGAVVGRRGARKRAVERES